MAEGFKKISKKEKSGFMNIAQASLEECRYYEILFLDLNYGENAHLTEALEEASRLLNAYNKSLVNSTNIFLSKCLSFFTF